MWLIVKTHTGGLYRGLKGFLLESLMNSTHLLIPDFEHFSELSLNLNPLKKLQQRNVGFLCAVKHVTFYF